MQFRGYVLLENSTYFPGRQSPGLWKDTPLFLSCPFEPIHQRQFSMKKGDSL